MHSRPISLIILSLSLFLSASCISRQTSATLNDIETYIQSSPDSALAVIRAIDSSTLTTRSLKAHYALLHAMALDKNWIDTTDVNVVMPAVKYYSKYGTADQKMKAYYYLGRIFANGHNQNSAIISYTQAEESSTSSYDNRFKGLLAMAMADTYKSAHSSDKEREYIEKGMSYFQAANDSAHYNLSYGRLAMSYQEKKEWATADSLFRKGIELSANDTVAMRMFLVHYATMMALQPDTKPQAAIDLLNRARTEYGLNLSLKMYGLYAYASDLAGDDKTCDAIQTFLNAQPESRHKEFRYYDFLIARHRGDSSRAIGLLTDIYTDQDKAVDQMLNNSVTSVLQDYYQRQAIESRRRTQVQRLSFAVATLSLIFIFGAVILSFIRKREKERIAADNLIRIAEETNAMLVQTNSELEVRVEAIESAGRQAALEYQSKIASLQKSYIQLFKEQFETVRSLSKTYLKFQERPEDARKTAIYRKVKDIIYFIGREEKQQALFEEHINRSLNNVVARLKADLGKISSEDSRFICYMIAGFDPSLVATLLNLSLSNVYTKRSRMRDRIRQLDSPHKAEYLRVL